MKEKELLQALSEEQLNAVNGGLEQSRPAVPVVIPDEAHPDITDDPNWKALDYSCPRCKTGKVYQWICPGTMSELRCSRCDWRKWF